jgi:hypothetical protein
MVSIAPAADAFTRSGAYSGQNFGKDYLLEVKSTTEAGNSRNIYLKFDLSSIPETSVSSAKLRLYNTYIQDDMSSPVQVYAVTDDGWNEQEITWSSAPQRGVLLDNLTIEIVNRWVTLDVTGFVLSELAGDKTVSLCITAPSGPEVRTSFASQDGLEEFSPFLLLNTPGAAPGTVPDPEPEEPGSTYPTVSVDTKGKTSVPSWKPYDTVTLENVTGFTAGDESVEYSQYGGWKGKQVQAKGFFYPLQIDGRWWLVDPDGYLYINKAIVSVEPGSGPSYAASFAQKFGSSVPQWADFSVNLLKGNGFNGTGAWTQETKLNQASERLASTRLLYFIQGYADILGITVQQSGHKGYPNDVMPILDPGFAVYADQLASTLAANRNDRYLLGYFTDNELPSTPDLLNKYLAVNLADPALGYTGQAAWTWFKERKGEAAVVADIDWTDQQAFLEYLYGRYYEVTTQAIKKYDPNHLMLGTRLTNPSFLGKGIFQAAGRYLDVIAMNYYMTWTPDSRLMNLWTSWSGKPVIITEWYTKGEDSGFPNTSGAGWIVKTQDDRGKFYQNYALALLESKNIIGWHWFKYLDNDPYDTTADPSNTDANKGILNIQYDPYPSLLNRMKSFNDNVYPLISFLDGGVDISAAPPYTGPAPTPEAPEEPEAPDIIAYTKLSPTADAFVRSGSYSSDNYGTDPLLTIKQQSNINDGYSRKSYMSFDLSSLSLHSLGIAELKLYAVSVENQAMTAPVSVHWAVYGGALPETAVTWANAPAATAFVSSLAGVTSAGQWYSFDLTSLVKAQLEAGSQVLNICLTDDSKTSLRVDFASREYGTAAYRPVLNVGLTEEAIVSYEELSPAADTLVRSGSYSTANFGTEQLLTVKQESNPGLGFSRKMYMSFDLEGVVPGSIGTAELKLYAVSVQDSTRNMPVSVHRAVYDGVLPELAVTWANAPAAEAATGAAATVASAGQWYSFDLTSMVKAQLEAGGKVLNLCLTDDSVSSLRVDFASREYNNAAYRPVLRMGLMQ